MCAATCMGAVGPGAVDNARCRAVCVGGAQLPLVMANW